MNIKCVENYFVQRYSIYTNNFKSRNKKHSVRLNTIALPVLYALYYAMQRKTEYFQNYRVIKRKKKSFTVHSLRKRHFNSAKLHRSVIVG